MKKQTFEIFVSFLFLALTLFTGYKLIDYAKNSLFVKVETYQEEFPLWTPANESIVMEWDSFQNQDSGKIPVKGHVNTWWNSSGGNEIEGFKKHESKITQFSRKVTGYSVEYEIIFDDLVHISLSDKIRRQTKGLWKSHHFQKSDTGDSFTEIRKDDGSIVLMAEHEKGDFDLYSIMAMICLAGAGVILSITVVVIISIVKKFKSIKVVK